MISHAVIIVFSFILTALPLQTSKWIGLEKSLYLMFFLEFTLGFYVAFFVYKEKWILGSKKVFFSCLFFIIIIQLISYILKDHGVDITEISVKNTIPYLFAIIAVPFYEEFIYRGCLLDLLYGISNKNLLFSSLLSSLVFCMMHTQYTDVIDYIALFSISLVLTFARVSSGKIFPSILLHSSMNAFVILLSFYKIF